jgi:hypothetical protein
MKTRSGFVSNSSSSSFVLVVEKTAFDNALKKMHKFYKAFATQSLGYHDKDSARTFMGKKVVVLSGVNSSEDTPEIAGFSKVESLPPEMQGDAYDDDDYLQFDTGIALSLMVETLAKMEVDHIYDTTSC